MGLGLAVPADGHYLVVDRNLIELLTLAFLAALPVTALPGVDRWFVRRRQAALADGARGRGRSGGRRRRAGSSARPKPAPADAPGRREMLANLASLPFLGAFAYALFKKRQWSSYEERNLVDAVTAASTKTLDVASLRDLKGTLPTGKIGGREFSRLILGGNLLSGWAHSRDLIYVSQLVKAYHNKDRIFATLLVAEKCGVNTLLTNPILCTLIDEYWKRRIGKIQFISDCAGLDYDDKGAQPDAVRQVPRQGAARDRLRGGGLLHPGRDGGPLRQERPAGPPREGDRPRPEEQGDRGHRGPPPRDAAGLRGRGNGPRLLDEDDAPPRLLVGAPPRGARQHVLPHAGRDDGLDARAARSRGSPSR